MRVTGGPLRTGLAVAAVFIVLLALPGLASAADPPPCESLGYNAPFLIIDGKSDVAGNTRYISLRESPRSAAKPNNSTGTPNNQADVEKPFNVTVAPSNEVGTHTYTIHDYAQDQVPVKFSRGETDDVSAKYIEVHTKTMAGITTITTQERCTRKVKDTFNAPPQRRRHRRHHHEPPGDR